MAPCKRPCFWCEVGVAFAMSVVAVLLMALFLYPLFFRFAWRPHRQRQNAKWHEANWRQHLHLHGRDPDEHGIPAIPRQERLRLWEVLSPEEGGEPEGIQELLDLTRT